MIDSPPDVYSVRVNIVISNNNNNNNNNNNSNSNRLISVMWSPMLPQGKDY